MRPVLFTLFGMPVNSYGVSKALAACVAAWLLQQAFRRRGWRPQDATNIVVVATLSGFTGAKIYYLSEHIDTLSWHHFGPMGFTWYGGLFGGALGVVLMARRYRIPLAELAGLSAVPLAVAYGIGRLGCLLSGDGTYGKASTLPWAMAFPNGTVPTTTPVHPTPLYEALVAFALAACLWWLQSRLRPVSVFAVYLGASGLARLLVEQLRVNEQVLLELTQPQLWSGALIVLSAGLIWYDRYRNQTPARQAPA